MNRSYLNGIRSLLHIIVLISHILEVFYNFSSTKSFPFTEIIYIISSFVMSAFFVINGLFSGFWFGKEIRFENKMFKLLIKHIWFRISSNIFNTYFLYILSTLFYFFMKNSVLLKFSYQCLAPNLIFISNFIFFEKNVNITH